MLSDLLKYHHVEIDASKTLSSLTGFSVPIHLGYQEMFLKIAISNASYVPISFRIHS